ncbi:MAG: redoxin domain-containing protein [Deltaproteobacteria bacterium]|nr:redoxin domain-containing protein [Deltaproteobacteria bacterium]
MYLIKVFSSPKPGTVPILGRDKAPSVNGDSPLYSPSDKRELSPQRRGGAEKRFNAPALRLPLFDKEGIRGETILRGGARRRYSASLRLLGKYVVHLLFLLSLGLSGCGDLIPSGSDKRPTVEAGTTGTQVGQTAPDFAIVDSQGNTRTLSQEVAALAPGNAVVFYFTMWCPICDSHQGHILSSIIPAFPGSKYFLVDYVSGSVGGTRQAEVSNGYSGSLFTALADTDRSVLNLFNATMSTTVVIDSTGVVRMNEDYKDGSRLMVVLGGL